MDPADVKGIPIDTEDLKSGDDQGTAALARSLGVDPDNLDEENEDDDEDEEDESDDSDLDDANSKQRTKDEATDRKSKGKSKKAPRGSEEDPNQLGEHYAKFLQDNAEEAYATALHRAQNEAGYLDKLVKSTNKMDLRIAQKLLERNDFGAKTIEDYRRNTRKKEAGDDPAAQRHAEILDRIERIEQGQSEKGWKQWKRENAVAGEAEKLADDIHARYPDMPEGEVMDMVRGKLGAAYRKPQKESMSAGYGGDVSPEGEDLNVSVNPKLRGALLPNFKKTAKFAKSYMKEMRR